MIRVIRSWITPNCCHLVYAQYQNMKYSANDCHVFICLETEFNQNIISRLKAFVNIRKHQFRQLRVPKSSNQYSKTNLPIISVFAIFAWFKGEKVKIICWIFPCIFCAMIGLLLPTVSSIFLLQNVVDTLTHHVYNTHSSINIC